MHGVFQTSNPSDVFPVRGVTPADVLPDPGIDGPGDNPLGLERLKTGAAFGAVFAGLLITPIWALLLAGCVWQLF